MSTSVLCRVSESGCTLTFRFYTNSTSVRKVWLLLQMMALRGSLFNLTVVHDGLRVLTSPGESGCGPGRDRLLLFVLLFNL